MTSLRKVLDEEGYESTDLDFLVHEVASQVASRVNNEGMKEQIEFLNNSGVSDADILLCLQEEAAE